MLIKKDDRYRYIVDFDNDEISRLELLSHFFTNGDTQAMLDDVIEDGLRVGKSILMMGTDKNYVRECLLKQEQSACKKDKSELRG